MGWIPPNPPQLTGDKDRDERLLAWYRSELEHGIEMQAGNLRYGLALLAAAAVAVLFVLACG